MSRRAVLSMFLLLAAILAGGCGQPDIRPQFKLTDLSGASFGRELNLLDHNGKPRTLADFRGKVVVIFFGFAQCPDICPTILSELATWRARGQDASDAGLFVDGRPERDTHEGCDSKSVIDPRFLGSSASRSHCTSGEGIQIFYQSSRKRTRALQVDHRGKPTTPARALRLYERTAPGASAAARYRILSSSVRRGGLRYELRKNQAPAVTGACVMRARYAAAAMSSSSAPSPCSIWRMRSAARRIRGEIVQGRLVAR